MRRMILSLGALGLLAGCVTTAQAALAVTLGLWSGLLLVATHPIDVSVAVAIRELALFLPDGETVTITDPTSYYLRYRWVRMMQGADRMKDVPELSGGQAIRLQVTLESASPDTDIVALRYGFGGFNKRRVKMNLVSETFNGEKYVRVFETSRTRPVYVHYYRGFFHMGVDAITHETLFDDAAPYAASWWGVPYRVF